MNELNRRLLNGDVEQGNVGMVLEHIAEADLTDQELKTALVDALRNRANQKDGESFIVDKSWGIAGKGSFEKSRANNLRKLADRISKLF